MCNAAMIALLRAYFATKHAARLTWRAANVNLAAYWAAASTVSTGVAHLLAPDAALWWGVTVGTLLTVARWKWPNERIKVIRRIEAAVKHVTKTNPEDLRKPMVYDCVWDGPNQEDKHTLGLSAFKVRYGEHFRDGNPRLVDDLKRQIQSNLGARNRYDFVAHTEFNYMTGELIVDHLPARKVWLQLYPDVKWNLIPVGIRDGNKVEVIDLRRTPHALIVSSTGAGKTVLLRDVAAGLLHAPSPWRLWVCDPKRVELSFLRGMPGVERVATTPDAMIQVVRDAQQLMHDWYAARERGDAPEPLWLALLIDEVAELVEMTGEKLRGPLGSLVRLGRKARVHGFMATQRPDVEYLPGEARSNVKYRVAAGPLDEQGSRMVFGDAKVGQAAPIGRTSSIPGRCFVSNNGVLREMQAFYVADPVYLDDDLPVATAKRERDRSATLFPTPTRPEPDPDPEPDGGGESAPESRKLRRPS